jgi:uncharacterized protein YndB with AHSA1/START domain
MVTTHKIEYTTVIAAPVEKVWEALTQPELVKQYFFGTQLITDWRVGGPISFVGEWEGQTYEDKGQILEYEPNKRLAYSYLSSWSGKEDKPENYLWVCYQTEPAGQTTRLSIHQSNYDKDKAEHSKQGSKSIIDGLKGIVENKAN